MRKLPRRKSEGNYKKVSHLHVADKEYPLKGKYVCSCGPDCKCNTVSVNSGRCSCGVPLMKVE